MNDDTLLKQIDDIWNPCHGGQISQPGACWVRIADRKHFTVVCHIGDTYTLQGGMWNSEFIEVHTADLPEMFRPT